MQFGLITVQYQTNKPEQLNPSPYINGGKQVQVKVVELKSLLQAALIAQGAEIQGSGTTRK